MTSKRAYTLIELLIVLALFSLILAIAIPNFNIIKSFREKHEFNQIKRDLLSTKNRAILDNHIYEFNLNIATNGYEIKVLNSKAPIKVVQFQYGNSVVLSAKTTTNSIVFNPSGAPAGAGTFVTSNSKGEKCEFRITPVTGKVNIYHMK